MDQLLDHYYGLLCLELLSHVVNAGLLAYLDSLDRYQDGAIDGTSLLQYIFQALIPSTEKWNFADFFGGHEILRRGGFMTSQGGFTISRAERLLWHLWKDRHTLLALNVHMGPGHQWATLFFVLVHSVLAQGYVPLL